MIDPPIYVNVRDRVSPLRQLVSWLERAGHERIVLLDNASTYEPLLDYLEASPHQVVRLGSNLGSRSIWQANLVPSEPFVFTDPDLVPTDDCPLDLVAHLGELLDRHPEFPKAGLGLHVDDVPETLPSLDWERSLVAPERQIEPGAYDSLIDTTFALYRPGTPFGYKAIRTGFPYQCRHVSWYAQFPLTAEDAHYLKHAIAGPMGSSWAQTAA